MSDIDRTIKDLRPKLREIAPPTFWVSIIFGVFNTLVGYSLYNVSILVHLKLVGVIPLKGWALIFFFHGILMLYSIAVNNWKLTRSLHFIGVAVKSAWWLELLAGVIVSGSSPFLLYVWSVLLSVQIVFCIYFTPKVRGRE